VYNADEAFFTSTSPCVLPVTRVDRRTIGDGKPGPVVGRLLRAWSELVGVDIVEQARRYAPLERLESKVGS
jgi:branched-subunit amino acid aminotransferase/4-amino-4-deoxychorismate lyase